jgi:hypothetical protein
LKREVDLLLVDLDLREVGVDGEVRREVRGDAVFHVAADVAGHIVAQRRRAEAIRREPRDRIRLQLEVLARGRQIEADERAAGRNPVERLRSGEVLRHRREVRPFVLAAHRAAQLNSPDLVGPGAIAQRLEGDRHLDRPPAVEAAGLRRPHRIPVDVRAAFVDDRVGFGLSWFRGCIC